MVLCARARGGPNGDSDSGAGPDICRGGEWLYALPGRENRDGPLGEKHWSGIPGGGDVVPALAVDRGVVVDRFHRSEARRERPRFGQTDGEGGLESAR